MKNYYITESGAKHAIVDAEAIDLSLVGITEIKITDLPMCKWMNLSHNNLTSFEADLPRCEKFFIDHNNLTSFEADLPKCEWLNISNNNLTSFKADLSMCKKLHIYRNNLKSFDANLPMCEMLYISHNNLTSFDAKLPRCKDLLISSNNLTSFEAELPKCKTLWADITTSIITPDGKTLKGIDGIPTVIDHERKVGEFTVFKGSYLKGGKKVFVALKEAFAAHGDSLKKAIEDCNFKFLQSTIDVEAYAQEVKERGVMTVMDYRLLTGACKSGCMHFLKQKGVKETEMELEKALELVQGSYGSERVNKLFAA